MHDNRDEIDLLLDSALATYADPGPDSGLEQRILTRIAADAHAAPRRRWLPWAIALPAAASLLIFILILHPWTNHTSVLPQQADVSHRPMPPIEAANRSSSPPARTRRSEAPLRRQRPRHRALAIRSAPLPKLDVFPTPQPLSPQERALVNFAAHATKSERESLVTSQQQADAPLHIAAIQITPLQPPAPGAN